MALTGYIQTKAVYLSLSVTQAAQDFRHVPDATIILLEDPYPSN